MLPFSQFQAAISSIRLKDDTALRSIGLAKLSRTFDAYPIVKESRRLFFLLPKNMDPGAARHLPLVAANKLIIVLEQANSGVAKVWPNPQAVDAAAAAVPAPAAPTPAGDAAEAGLAIEFVDE